MRKKPVHLREFSCVTCKQEVGVPLDTMKHHMANIHKIDIAKEKGSRQMNIHLDGTDFYESTFTWTFGEVSFTEHTRDSRTGENAALWGAE